MVRHLTTYSQHNFYTENTIQQQLQLNFDSCLGVQHSRQLLFLTNSGLFSSRSWTATSWSCQAELKSLLHSTTVDVWRCSVSFVFGQTSHIMGRRKKLQHQTLEPVVFSSLLLCSHSVSRYCSSKSGGRKRGAEQSVSLTLCQQQQHFPVSLGSWSAIGEEMGERKCQQSQKGLSLSLSLFYQKRSSSTEGESKFRSSCNTSPLSSSTHALFSSFLFFLVFFWFSVLLLLSFPSVCCEASLRESVCVCFCCCYQISSSACASRILVRKCSRIFCVDGRTGLVWAKPKMLILPHCPKFSVV